MQKSKVDWTLEDLNAGKFGDEKNGLKVFSCFHCGGGSTMGYKLAGFDVLGGVEIDPEMSRIYVKNHNPKHEFLMGVAEFNKKPNDELPKELFDLDILDGSPPCSSFSMSGSREDAWGDEKKFREGQANQVLDDLFFDFINTAKKLKPKIVVSENVKGLIMGNAKGYVKQIFKGFDDAGYNSQLFLLNAASMGVPQRRERTFFISVRKDINKKIKLNFNEQPINFEDIEEDSSEFLNNKFSIKSKTALKYWPKCSPGKSFSSVHENGSLFNWIKVHPKLPLNTLVSSSIRDGSRMFYHYKQQRVLTDIECIKGQTFPLDYNFLDIDKGYLIGMSVPPFMTWKIAREIKNQLLG